VIRHGGPVRGILKLAWWNWTEWFATTVQGREPGKSAAIDEAERNDPSH
jgi:hypothetical protein